MPRPLAGSGAPLLRLALAASLGFFTSIAFASVCCHAAAGDARQFVTRDGAVVDIQPVSALDCKGLETKLAEIDRTGYRGTRPTPQHDSDQPLFDYENKVARALYTRCGKRMTGDDATPLLRGAPWGRTLERN